MGRGDSLARQLQLIQLLDERRSLVVNEVATHLGYTPRTIYRDLSVLERVGVPIYQDHDGKRARWRVVEGSRRKLSVTLSWSEMLSLAAGRDLLSGLAGTLFHEAAISALEKIRAALPAPLATRALAAAAHLSANAGPAHDYERSTEVVARLVDAVERQETVRLSYRKPRARRYEERVVDPYHLHVQSSSLYLIGWCHAREAVRTFLVDRAGEVVSTGQRFERRGDFAPTDLLQGGFGPWAGRAERIRLRFDASAATWVAERKVHKSQSSQWRSDGKLDVSLQAPLSPALTAWLLGWGSKVEVLAPERLAQELASEHERAAGRGKKKKNGE